MKNFILQTDSYKLTHHDMYPEGTQNVYSYYESRAGAKYPYTVFFGLQAILKKYFVGVRVTPEDVNHAESFSIAHFGLNKFNRKMWDKIVNVHGGKLPLRIKAVPEGTKVPISNVLMTVEATDEDCAPLTNVCETVLTHIWYSSNVATISRDIKEYFQTAFEKTLPPNAWGMLPFMLHDFGFRGATCMEAAEMGGSAHLINFSGTDTMVGILNAQEYYGAGMAGFSVPASEHSVMTSLGEEGEVEMIRRLIEKYPTGILSVVGDSYSIVRFIELCGTYFKNAILNRDGKFVVRPDSPRFKGDKPCDQILWIAQKLEQYFGYTVNRMGYKELNPKVGTIYGDGLSVEEIKESIDLLVLNGYAASTSVFGQGGGLLQKHNRDTQRNAFKCSAQLRNGEWVDIFKNPLDSTKASKRGRLKLVKENGTFVTVSINDPRPDELVTVFENGVLTKDYTWEEVKLNTER